jgi:hypothetical protein
MIAWKTWITVASLTVGLSLAALEATANPTPARILSPTLSRSNLSARYSQAHAAGYDVQYYRIIAEQCGTLTREQRMAQYDSVNARLMGLRGEYKDAFFWDAFDQGKLEAHKDAYKTEGELCTCQNPNNFYNLSLACDVN